MKRNEKKKSRVIIQLRIHLSKKFIFYVNLWWELKREPNNIIYAKNNKYVVWKIFKWEKWEFFVSHYLVQELLREFLCALMPKRWWCTCLCFLPHFVFLNKQFCAKRKPREWMSSNPHYIELNDSLALCWSLITNVLITSIDDNTRMNSLNPHNRIMCTHIIFFGKLGYKIYPLKLW